MKNKVQYSVKKIGSKFFVYKSQSVKLGPFKTKEEAQEFVERVRLEDISIAVEKG